MEDYPIYLQIIAPDKVVFEGKVRVVRFPGGQAPFAVLKDHAPILTTLSEGIITYEGEAGLGKVPVKDGFVQVKNNTVYACVTPNL